MKELSLQMTEENKQKNSEVKRSSKNPQIKETSEEKKANKVTEMPSKEMASTTGKSIFKTKEKVYNNILNQN